MREKLMTAEAVYKAFRQAFENASLTKDLGDFDALPPSVAETWKDVAAILWVQYFTEVIDLRAEVERLKAALDKERDAPARRLRQAMARRRDKTDAP